MTQKVAPTALSQAWYNQRTWPDGTAITVADLQLNNLSPIGAAGPRGSQGFTRRDTLVNNPALYILADHGIDMSGDDAYILAEAGYMKGPNDAPGTTGWASDFKDVQSNNDWHVYIDTPNIVESTPTQHGTTFYWPVNGGSDGQYAKFTISLRPGAAASHQLQKGPLAAQGAGVYGNAPAPGTGGITEPQRAYELTRLKDGRYFYALTDADSKAEDSPHTGVSVAGAGKWPVAFGTPESQGLPKGLYLLSVSPQDASPADLANVDTATGIPAIVVPGTQALKMALRDAADGNDSAIDALQQLNIDLPDMHGLGGLEYEFKHLLG